MPFERSWTVLEWTEIPHASCYLLAPLAPLLAPTRTALRRVPRPFVPGTFWGRLLVAERSWSMPVVAFPSFHALWALIAADALRVRSRLWEAVAWSWAALITLSCATTPQPAVLDLLAAGALFVPIRPAGAALSSRAGRRGSPFLRLHKWYLDCTTEDGEAAIVYVGRITLGWLPVLLRRAAVGRPGRAPPLAPAAVELAGVAKGTGSGARGAGTRTLRALGADERGARRPSHRGSRWDDPLALSPARWSERAAAARRTAPVGQRIRRGARDDSRARSYTR